MTRSEIYRALILDAVPHYRLSPTCFNCAHFVYDGMYGDRSSCTIHREILAWESSMANLEMCRCYCDDWKEAEPMGDDE